METNAIETAIAAIQEALTAPELGTVFDHIPAKPNFPCVIITTDDPFITEGETYNKRLANLDIWVAAKPSSSPKELQFGLYKNIIRVLNGLETLDEISFNEVTNIGPIEFNQTKTLAGIISVDIEII